MKLLVNGSSSAGNQYLLISKSGTLAIEAGVSLSGVEKSIDFNIGSIDGCIITHEHGDHAKFAKNYANAGIDIYASSGTLDALKLVSHRTHAVVEMQYFMVGAFRVLPFKIKHDCKEPFGYLIYHHEMGWCMFLTDTWYCPYRFEGIKLNQLIVEANYDENILVDNLDLGTIHPKVGRRVRESHMELQVLKDLLTANDLTKVNNIVLIHLSSQNSDEKRFQKEITELTHKTVTVAKKGIEIHFDITPF